MGGEWDTHCTAGTCQSSSNMWRCPLLAGTCHGCVRPAVVRTEGREFCPPMLPVHDEPSAAWTCCWMAGAALYPGLTCSPAKNWNVSHRFWGVCLVSLPDLERREKGESGWWLGAPNRDGCLSLCIRDPGSAQGSGTDHRPGLPLRIPSLLVLCYHLPLWACPAVPSRAGL